MAGLFDFLEDPQTMGLLGGAAGMLNASGPSLMPRSFGQVLAAGMGGMNEARDRQMKLAQAKQLAELNGYKLKDAKSDLDKQEADRKRAEALRQFYMQDGQGGTTPMPGGQPAAQMLGAQISGAPEQTPPPQAPAAGGNQNQGVYQQRMGMAERLRRAGFAQEADAQEAAALKFQPKVKDWKAVTVNGKEMYAPYFEDGTPGQPVPLEVARELHFQSIGGKTLGVHPVTGAQVTSYANTMTPGESARLGLDREKFNFDKTKEAKPTFSAEVGGFITAPTKAMPNGAIAPLAGYTKREAAPTEFQGKSAAFGLRATEADKILSKLERDGVTNTGIIKSIAQGTGEMVPFLGDRLGSAIGSGVNALPTYLGGPSEQQQQVEQARRDFVNAVLRQESGAAIGPTEFENAGKQYFPQPGDTATVIAQKARNRELAIQGLQANAGRAALTAKPKPAGGGWSITKVGD